MKFFLSDNMNLTSRVFQEFVTLALLTRKTQFDEDFDSFIAFNAYACMLQR